MAAEGESCSDYPKTTGETNSSENGHAELIIRALLSPCDLDPGSLPFLENDKYREHYQGKTYAVFPMKLLAEVNDGEH